jgi:hypothetical protein
MREEVIRNRFTVAADDLAVMVDGVPVRLSEYLKSEPDDDEPLEPLVPDPPAEDDQIVSD